jgi:hypothetical protein
VGALALALGIGAAVTGGAGIATAEGPTDNAAGGSTAQSAPDATTSEGTADSPSDGADSPPDPAASSNAPKTRLGNGRDTSPASLPELISSIPQKFATALAQHTSGESSASSNDRTVRPTPRVRAHTRDTPHPAAATVRDVVHEDPFESRAPKPVPAPAPPVTTAVPVPASKSIAVVEITPTQTRTTPARPGPANPIAMVVGNVLSALGIAPLASSTGDSPMAPMPIVQAALQLVHREIERITLSLSHVWPTTASTSIPTNAVPAISPGVPAPTDEAPTAYGDIGKWMLQPNGQISNYGGLPYDGRTVLEPVNVIIVDPTSSSAAESACKLNTAMFWSGFPAQPVHSTGFRGTIDDVIYGQQPTGFLLGFSDNFFLFPNNHGRIFGPDPVETSTGYVWSGAFSTEEFVIYDFLPRHAYVSSNMARNALAMRLIASGQATYGGMVPLHNSYNTDSTTTGDHDGYAVVVVLK